MQMSKCTFQLAKMTVFYVIKMGKCTYVQLLLLTNLICFRYNPLHFSIHCQIHIFERKNLTVTKLIIDQ